VWALDASRPTPDALAALRSDDQVRVERGRWLVFAPVSDVPDTGLIFYPGAKVDPRAYAVTARSIAEQGYLVAVVPMPLNLAVFAPNRASDVIAAYPGIQHWAVGGQSVGGAMAARFAFQQPDLVDGLVLWAAYPADDLSQRELQAVSISGTRDGLATEAKIAASKVLLPATTRWVPIIGGNHAQFGSYGPQAGDFPATIDIKEQQAQVVVATTALLADLEP
jgi:pimeloyl-ACP methyl ester carboxylesterase